MELGHRIYVTLKLPHILMLFQSLFTIAMIGAAQSEYWLNSTFGHQPVQLSFHLLTQSIWHGTSFVETRCSNGRYWKYQLTRYAIQKILWYHSIHGMVSVMQ